MMNFLRTRFIVFFLAFAILAGGAYWGFSSRHSAPSIPPVSSSGNEIPASAQGAVSESIGRDDPAYHFVTQGGTYIASNKDHGYSASFSNQGVTISDFSFSLLQADYSDPTVERNKISYNRGLATEWYINGPAGIEQGFTLKENQPIVLNLKNADFTIAKDKQSATIATKTRTFTYTGLTAYDANGKNLPVHLENRYGALALVTDTRSAVFPITIDPFIQEQKLTASDGETIDNLGRSSLSMSGDGTRFAIGSFLDNVGTSTDQGSVYIFARSGTTWTEEQHIIAADGAASDNFGLSASLTNDGSRLIVGAPADTVTFSSQGSAYIYSRSGTVWTQEQKITASDASSTDKFGVSVSITGDGSRVVVGANLDDIGATADQGSAYIFSRSGVTWTEEQKITASDGAASDRFGSGDFNRGGVFISNDGTRLVVGAYLDNVGANTDQGSAYIFSRSDTTWTEEQHIIASDGATNDFFGGNLFLSSDGSRLAVGVNLDDIGSNSDQGSVYVYSRSGTTWTQEQKITTNNAANTYFGWSTAFSSDASRLAIGTLFGGASNQGSIYIFSRSGTTWTQGEQLTASDGASGDRFSWSISMSSDGTRIVGAAMQNDPGGITDQGAAYVYFLPPAIISVSVSGNGAGTLVSSDANINLTYSGATTVSTGNITPGNSISFTSAPSGSTLALFPDCVDRGGSVYGIGTASVTCAIGSVAASTTILAQFVIPASVGVGGGGGSYTPPVSLPPSVPLSTSTVPVPPPTLPTSTYQFTRNLRLGMIGDDVRELQKYLNKNGFILVQEGPGSSGNETTKFGAFTFAALIKFQEFYKNGILIPAGVPSGKGTGFLGPFTRMVLNR